MASRATWGMCLRKSENKGMGSRYYRIRSCKVMPGSHEMLWLVCLNYFMVWLETEDLHSGISRHFSFLVIIRDNWIEDLLQNHNREWNLQLGHSRPPQFSADINVHIILGPNFKCYATDFKHGDMCRLGCSVAFQCF